MLPTALRRRYDTILCSDVLYDRSLFTDLLNTMMQLDFEVLLLAYKQRHPEYTYAICTGAK